MTFKQRHERDLLALGMKPWYAVDLDGTLAVYGKWGDPIGKPILPMLAKVYDLRAKGKTVRLFTARASDPKLIKEIKEWLEPLGLADMDITNVKDLEMIELYDDRCVQMVANTGERADGRPL